MELNDIAMPGRKVPLLNGEFDPLTLSQTVDAIFGLIDAGRRGWVCTVNVAILMTMRRDAWLQGFVDRAALVIADGQPLVWCSRWLGGRLPERVTGVDLIDALCARADLEKKTVYLLGATAELVATLAARLRARYPALRVVYSDGYFSDDKASTRVEHIRGSGADILLVGMGVPRQEKFIERHWERLGVGIAIGVGGSFDVLAGLRLRAPVWMQNLGLEWLFRLIQEPRRLFLRYLVTNSQFVWLVLRALVKRVRNLEY